MFPHKWAIYLGGWGRECQEKRHFSSPLKSTQSRVLMRCTASFPFFLHVGDRVPHLPTWLWFTNHNPQKSQRADTHALTYLHWLQFIFRASEWVNSYFTLLNELPLPNAEYKVVDIKMVPFLFFWVIIWANIIVYLSIILYQGGFWQKWFSPQRRSKYFPGCRALTLTCTTGMSGWAPGLLSVEREIPHLDRLDITRP